jgi:hypothetical protein
MKILIRDICEWTPVHGFVVGLSESKQHRWDTAESN